MAEKLTTQLRFGWTTGTCATAGAYGAYMALVSGDFPDSVTIDTPSGQAATLALVSTSQGQGWAMAGVIKDAGDDPDVTHGAEIRVRVEAASSGDGVRFEAGEGVGVVTKAGLPIAVGEAAINPVPRQMMRDCIARLARETGGMSDVVITISVPDGEALAAKTWNPRLGIEGGISILGTTGVVRPFSCSAWIASIHRGIDVARANGITHVAGSTGATSEQAVKGCHDLPPIALLDMGDFVGGMLKYLRRHPIPRLTIAGGFAKMVKLAQGHGDLHSARSQIDFNALGLLGAEAGLNPDSVAEANSGLDVLQQASAKQRKILAGLVAEQARQQAAEILRQDAISLDLMIVGRDGDVLATAG